MIKNTLRSSGFTIVELLVVIVVIGILAAVMAVSYTGISQKAKIATMQSDLSNASIQLKLFQTADLNEYYPATIDCSSADSSTNKCIKPSGSNTYTYTVSNGTNPRTYRLIVNNGSTNYILTNDSAATGPWFSGLSTTALAGKYIYGTNLGSTFAFKTVETAISSPQGVAGLDPNYPSNASLVNPQTNSAVDFSEYPAQTACKKIGGRLPNVQELLAINTGAATYGNNFSGGLYWSSTDYNAMNAYMVIFPTGGVRSDGRIIPRYVRCIFG